MKKSTLVDAGPLVATFSRGDVHHLVSVEFFSSYRGELVTTWPVVAEACHLLRRAPEARINLLRWIERGALRLHESVADRVSDVIGYMEKYADLPMDLADASVVIAAIDLDIRDLASTDSDFQVYRLPDKRRLNNVLVPRLP